MNLSPGRGDLRSPDHTEVADQGGKAMVRVALALALALAGAFGVSGVPRIFGAVLGLGLFFGQAYSFPASYTGEVLLLWSAAVAGAAAGANPLGLGLLAALGAVAWSASAGVGAIPWTPALTRGLAVAATALAASGLGSLGGPELPHTTIPALQAAGSLVAAYILDSLAEGVLRARREASALRACVLDELAQRGLAHASMGFAGLLAAVGVETVGPLSVLLALLLLGVLSQAFHSLREVRAARLETARGVMRLTEVAGYATYGHSSRVAELAVAVAKELGLAGRVLHDLEYAALLHELGRVTREADAFPELEEVARVGARLLARVKGMQAVAALVGKSASPYRRRGEYDDRSVPLAARIVKVCSSLDEAVHREGLSVKEAYSELMDTISFSHDPVVVAALGRVLRRKGLID